MPPRQASVSFGFIADSIGRKRTYVIYLIAAAVLLPLYGMLRLPTVLLVLGPFVAFFGTGYFSGLGAVVAELYPTAVRATAAGFCYNVGRIASAAAPYTVGSLATTRGFGVAFMATMLTRRTLYHSAMFGQMLQEEGLDKLYLGVVKGKSVPTGSISAALEGKEAETRFRVLFQGKGFAFVAIWPVTGRMHQIRQHFKIIGHPIRGDKRYGGGTLPDYPGHLLHSFRTTFVHPSTGTRLTLHAPLPAGFVAQLRLMAGDMLPPLLRELPDL